MARNAHNATWRACQRIIDVLDANVVTELAADAPAGLNVAAPTTESYYALASAEDVRAHVERNHPVQVYVFPSGERERHERTVGASAKSIATTIEITIAVRVTEELGAEAYSASWKNLTPKEREFLRCETYLGAIQDAIDSKIRGPAVSGDDIVQAFWQSSQSGANQFKQSGDEPGTWGAQVWSIIQIINVPIQTS